MGNKKGQVTIFVILGIIIVVSIIMLALFLSNLNKEKREFLNPKQYIESCIKKEILKPIPKIMQGGGVIDSKFFVLYMNEKYNYLCYTANFLERCNNIYPQLKKTIEQEIQIETEEKIKECFTSLKEWYEKRGYSVNSINPAVSIEIIPNQISILAKRKLEISKNEEVQIFDNFDTYIQSDFFDIVSIVQDVINDESKFCEFEYMGYTLANSQFRMRFINYNDNHLYRIKKINSEEEFKFATRGCVHWRGKPNE